MKLNGITRNALWLILGKAVQLLVDLVAGVLSVRYLGPANYGLISYAAAYTGFFSAVCTLGIPSILVRELVDEQEKEGEILGTSLFLRGISGMLSAAVIACIVHTADRGDRTVMAVACLSSLGMVLQSFEVFRCWFQSRLQSRVTAVVLLTAHLLAAAYKLLLLRWQCSVIWFAFAAVTEQLCAAALLMGAYRRYQGGRLCISRERAVRLLQKSCHFILPGLMVAVYAQTDKIMLKQMIGEAEIGYYSTAVSLCNVWCFVLSAVIDSVYPEITKLHKTDKKRFIRRNKQLYAFVFYLSAAVSLVLCCFAEPLLGLLYGDAYLPAAAPLRIIAWYTGFSYLGVARNAWVVCEERQRYLIWVYAAAALANVLLNFLLIPVWGAAGAAAASLTAQVVTVLVAPCFIRGLRENAALIRDAIFLRDVIGTKES